MLPGSALAGTMSFRIERITRKPDPERLNHPARAIVLPAQCGGLLCRTRKTKRQSTYTMDTYDLHQPHVRAAPFLSSANRASGSGWISAGLLQKHLQGVYRNYSCSSSLRLLLYDIFIDGERALNENYQISKTNKLHAP